MSQTQFTRPEAEYYPEYDADTEVEEPAATSTPRARKRSREPKKWRKAKESRDYNKGTRKTWCGTVTPRRVKGACKEPEGCMLACAGKIDRQTQEEILSKFWRRSRGQYGRYAWIRSYVRTEAVQPGRYGVRRLYFLPFNGVPVKVCSHFWYNTLNISFRMVEGAESHFDEDGFREEEQEETRGGSNRTPADNLAGVREHINSIQRVPSHHCRSRSAREYLPSTLCLARLYSMYREGRDNPVSDYIYRKVFNTEFNLSFHQPLKDACQKCTVFNQMAHPTPEETTANEAHRAEAEAVRAQKARDAVEAKAAPNLSIACFDLMKAITLPKSNIGASYYLRKLKMQNLTVFELDKNNVTCYCWTEDQCGAGPREIGSCVHQWITEQAATGVREFRMYSDSCSGQNRNRYITAMFIYTLLSTTVEKITHKFFVSGHSFMEADGAHGKIETAFKGQAGQRIHTPASALTIIEGACRRRYRTEELTLAGRIDWADVHYQLMGTKSVPAMMKVRAMSYTKEQGDVVVRLTESVQIPESQWQVFRWRKRGAQRTEVTLKLGGEPAGIDAEKKADLVKMSLDFRMFEDVKRFYANLPLKRAGASTSCRRRRPVVSSEADTDLNLSDGASSLAE